MCSLVVCSILRPFPIDLTKWPCVLASMTYYGTANGWGYEIEQNTRANSCSIAEKIREMILTHFFLLLPHFCNVFFVKKGVAILLA